MSTQSDDNPKTTVQCHYDVLCIERDADSSTIKKSYRKLSLVYHPDKNVSKTHEEKAIAADKFRRIQQAYEVLSDPQEKRWYDEHRDAILSGWTSGGTDDDDDLASKMLFRVGPYMNPGCYDSYDNDDKNSFWKVYTQVFEGIVSCEMNQSDATIDLPTRFGHRDSPWEDVRMFYQSWESFSSALNFAWEDTYNANEDGPNRWVRRRMEEDNKKARKIAKKEYNNDIITLVAFVKRRDPRVKAKQEERERQKAASEAKRRQDAIDRKKEQKEAKEKWREEAQRELEAAEEQDRLAGRVRLADLEDDYDYGGGKKSKKKKGKGKKGKRNATTRQDEWNDASESDKVDTEEIMNNTESDGQNADATDDDCDEQDTQEYQNGTEPQDAYGDSDDDEVEKRLEEVETELDQSQNDQDEGSDSDDEEEEEEEEEEEPDVWRCECCRKDFKSEGQMENHFKSKKHKETYKKFLRKVKEKEEELLAELMEEMDLEVS
jgi:DnaJ homolog subfamily A member 5